VLARWPCGGARRGNGIVTEKQKGGSGEHDLAGLRGKSGLVHIALDDTPKESGDQHFISMFDFRSGD